MVVQKNHQLTKVQRKLNWHGDLFRIEEKLHGKNPTGWFLGQLMRIHYYQNKWSQVKQSQYLIPTYSWTLTPIPNWTCSVMSISHFQCTAPSTWLTNRCTDPSMRLDHQLEKDVGCKVLQFITQWRSWNSTAASSRER